MFEARQMKGLLETTVWHKFRVVRRPDIDGNDWVQVVAVEVRGITNS